MIERNAKSGSDLGAEHARRFLIWINERESQNDYLDYVRAGKLNRSEVSKELGFGRSVFAQNPEVKTLALSCDDKWGALANYPARSKTANEESSARERAVNKVKRSEASNSRLLERLAMLEEENRQLKQQLGKLNYFASAKQAFEDASAVLKESIE